ncbi:dimethyladenosine transferase 1, mitochondrial-like isoform X2 [Halichondria panicea]|uniref:dimethyladenosine transferase 1, mitochondrial-like isoform X2 n=1 Tax=Halichondria panicea TaxID=6063 RepID=UPI00312BC339
MARRLPPLPTIADIIRLYGLSARSQLSQNFLLDLNITERLVRVAGGDLSSCCVCEVGPGPGSLTRSILNAGAAHLIAVERDRRFLPSLELLSEASEDRLKVVYGDALDFNIEESCASFVEGKSWEGDPPNFHLMGNLPFNVSIPLLLKWLSLMATRTGPFSLGRTQLTLTFQKEVAERIMAPPNDPQRSRLSVMTQHLCHVKWGFKIRGKAFTPPPKVDAVVLKLTPLVTPRITVDYSTLEKVVKALFQYRRKYIRRGATLLFPEEKGGQTKAQREGLVEELFRLSGVEETLRPQALTIEQFGALTSAYSQLVNTDNVASL